MPVLYIRMRIPYYIIWDPHFIIDVLKDSDALERVQRRAARWITSKHDRGTKRYRSVYTSFTLNLWRNADASVD